MENFVSDPGMIDTKSFKIFFIISVNEAVSQSTATLYGKPNWKLEKL